MLSQTDVLFPEQVSQFVKPRRMRDVTQRFVENIKVLTTIIKFSHAEIVKYEHKNGKEYIKRPDDKMMKSE